MNSENKLSEKIEPMSEGITTQLIHMFKIGSLAIESFNKTIGLIVDIFDNAYRTSIMAKSLDISMSLLRIRSNERRFGKAYLWLVKRKKKRLQSQLDALSKL